MYRETTNVEHEMYNYSGNNWSHRNGNKCLKKTFEAVPGRHSLYLEHRT
jgi:hypothetical protein